MSGAVSPHAGLRAKLRTGATRAETQEEKRAKNRTRAGEKQEETREKAGRKQEAEQDVPSENASQRFSFSVTWKVFVAPAHFNGGARLTSKGSR